MDKKKENLYEKMDKNKENSAYCSAGQEGQNNS